MPETIYVVMFDGYSSECYVGFTSDDKAQAHADKVGGFVHPIMRMNRAPKSRIRYSRSTHIDSRGIIKRDDAHASTVWEYEAAWAHPVVTRTHVGKDPLLSNKTLYTDGFDKDEVDAVHEDLIKENGGIKL